ncbi:uncharacterized protein B0T15DRAFT_496245 [Chaetomium strumarium]|uniref:Nucleoside phosphorylase domain-containing protein n=1 Tax=Chaetomium strumarium TaxID=1170767 RepID=A0AAJ0GPU9_9PEZI|nr:hypothetical protein B0T15DRAFT_496245 [Chaetomium strumarium]
MAKFATAESPGFHSLCAELKRWIKKTSQPNGNPRERQGLEQATAVGPVSWGWGSDVPAQYPMGYSTQAISPPPEKTDPDLSSFSVAIFCAFAEEADAVEKQFDRHWDYERINSMIDHTDTNAYSFGRIGNHNVVLVHLGGKGKIPTAPAAKSCRNTFPNAKLFLVVGVCGAVNQNRGRRVALGDVIISKGVVEYDLNRQYDGYFELKDESKHRLHVDLEGTLDKFQTDQGRRTLEDTTAKHLDGNLKKKPPNNDGLSHSSPAVHIGWVASGNSVFKSKEKRDEIVRLYDQVIGFEMEGAAVWHQGRACLVVKGVSDHADIDKTKDWQPYAAAAAAACAKAILGYWKPRRQVLAGNSDANSKHQPQGPWFTVAYPENQHFTRRKTVDAKLDTMIREFAQQEKRKGYTRIALHGGPGVGKSQIVLDLAYGLHRNRPDISIFWVAAASREKFRQSFVSIANTCNIPGKDALRSVKKWLEKEHRRPWLMIVDNADNESLFYRTEQHSGNKSPVDSAAFEDVLNQERPLVSYIPNCPQGAIVFTTRFKGLGIRLTNNPNGSSCIPVERLDADESIRMLRAELGDIDAEEHELKDLANRLDNIPFAMIQATSFIKKNGIKSIGQFLQDLDGAGDDDLLTLLSEGVDTWGRDEDAPRSIVKMYLLSLREVRHRDRFAWDCLTLMSLFDREDIPREFVTIYSKRRLQKESTGLDVSRSLGVLMDFSLIRPDRLDEYDMHRLQQILTQRWLDKQGPETRRAFERDAILTMLEAFPISCYEKPNRPKYSRYLPHVRAVVGLEGTQSEEEKRAKVSLCVRAAMLLLYQRQWEGGAKFLEEAVPLRQEVMGEELGRYPAARSLAAMYELLIEEEKSGWKNKKYKDRSKSKVISGPEVLKKHMPEDMIARAAAETERE